MKFYKLATGIATAAFVFVGVGMASSATAQAATIVNQASSSTVSNGSTTTVATSTENYSDLELSFDYEVSDLEDGEELKYGWKPDSTGTEHELGSITSSNDQDNPENGSVTSVSIDDQEASASNFTLYFANTGQHDSDDVTISNIALTGTPAEQNTDPISVIDSDDTYTDLQTAIDETPASSTIVVEIGAYTPGSTLTIDKKELTLKAADDDSDKPKIDVAGLKTGIEVTADDVTIDGFEIVGDESTGNGIVVGPGSDNATIENNKIHGMGEVLDSFGSRGILVWGNDWDGNTIADFGSWTNACKGQNEVNPPTGTQIADNEIYNVKTMGISLGDCTSDAEIKNNTVYDLDPLNTQAGKITIGIQGRTASDVSISGNEITGADDANANVGINLDKFSSGKISSNTFNKTPLRVSHIAGASDITADAGEYAKADFEDVLNGTTKTGYYSSIQTAIDETETGNTVQIAPGTYEESVTIDKEGITLESAAGPKKTKISADENRGVSIKATDVTVRGFTVTSGMSEPAEFYGIRVEPEGSVGNTLIEDNIVEDIEATSRPAGISIDMKDKSTGGDDEVAASTTVRNNTIRNITNSDTSAVAKGINPNERVNNLTIENNTIQNIGGGEGAGAIGIDFSSDTKTGESPHAGPKDFVIEGNDINGIRIGENVDTVWKDDLALYFHDYGDLGEHSVAENKFRDGDVLYNTESISNPDTLDATHNWWGNASGPSGLTENIDYDPYYIDAGLNNLSNEVGPSAGGGVAAPSRSGGGGGSDDNGNEQRVAGAQDENADGETDDSSDSSEEESEDNEKEGMVKGVQVSVDGDMTNEQILSTLSQVLEQTLAIAEQLDMDVERLRSNY